MAEGAKKGPDFEAIVVGAGMAGSACAINLAREGVSTLLVDQARPIGSKSLSGGIIWGNDLEALVPGWQEKAPIERPVTRKGLNFMTENSQFGMFFERGEWRKRPYNAVTVLRSKFDKWLSERAGEAGATVVDGVPVNELVMEGDKVVGIRQDGDVVGSNVVVLADGANSRLTMDLGLRKGLEMENTALGIKETIRLGRTKLESRFGISKDAGAANEYVLGFMGKGVRSAGFVYTNIDTVSLGVIIDLASLWKKDVDAHDIVERFRLHPTIAPLVEDGDLVEYGAKPVPEGGIGSMPPLSGKGFLVVGDAAGFTFNNGFMTQGMNYAVASGRMAAETVVRAKKNDTWTSTALEHYRHLLDRSYVLQDMVTFRNAAKFLWNPHMYKEYPMMIEDLFTAMYEETGRPKKRFRKLMTDAQKKAGVSTFSLMKDGAGVRHI